ncbi:MAG: 2-C-methyl-D-erythritol 2,4-cyclodiphosphate synthase [Acidobacteria bacterium]|nr:MAG: 2-C-methyl-D-erythritol 2,4-cyclodiphosphate synthase [Acidobacteriota bacterium]PYY02895.1 MAG: 2-C-methyl-D-erythritol 2,4-cyclodiphosphate synthase [Acidobacteriota bacterium]PYY22663.1 MAG: 2-C-methyl-D-erythritol 2,4-cyclodiphosphate synthase [Acidobacteriota bacterium]
MRIGYGWDSHEFKKGVPLRIGGVELKHTHGLAGHSDGDVLLHALTDALLGAIAAGDIGSYFPPSDPQWKGADSSTFVLQALTKVREAGWEVCNVDSTLILDAPKIGPVADRIRESIAQLLEISREDVGVKAKTPEGMGTEKAAIAHVVVLLEKHEDHKRLEVAAAFLEADNHVDEVVKKLVRDVGLERTPTKK